MSLDEAFETARQGCFVTCDGLAEDESIHYYDGKFYYEDGAVVALETMHMQSWAILFDWHIKVPDFLVDRVKLKSMHEQSKGLMLQDATYEECFIRLTVGNLM